ncbi:hypothetical protein [Mesorhizobium sp. M1163]|uniref:hypothetical protein n=1 Tax=Mesorhizobium sp. M1163 TaxID=2957065 RepID=UPI00333CB12A
MKRQHDHHCSNGNSDSCVLPDLLKVGKMASRGARCFFLALIFAAGSPGHVLADAAVEPDSLPTTPFSSQAQSCGIDPETLGLTPLLSRKEVSGRLAHLYLRAKLVRIENVTQPGLLSPAQKMPRLRFTDFFIIYHLPEDLIGERLDQAVNEIASMGRIASIAECTFAEGRGYTAYAPLAQKEHDGNLQFLAEVMTFSRRTVVSVQSEQFASAGPGQQDGTGSLIEANPPDPVGAPPAPKVTWTRNFYPWAVDMDFTASKPGDEVFAVDKVKCNKHGNFIAGSAGKIAAPEQNTASDADGVPVIRLKMLASNVNFGASLDPLNRQVAESSVNPTEYWCIPAQEFCYRQVEFGDFGIQAKPNDLSHFSKDDVVSLRNGLVAALARVVMDKCPQEPMEATEN